MACTARSVGLLTLSDVESHLLVFVDSGYVLTIQTDL